MYDFAVFSVGIKKRNVSRIKRFAEKLVSKQKIPGRILQKMPSGFPR